MTGCMESVVLLLCNHSEPLSLEGLQLNTSVKAGDIQKPYSEVGSNNCMKNTSLPVSELVVTMKNAKDVLLKGSREGNPKLMLKALEVLHSIHTVYFCVF